TREGQGPVAEYKYWRERDAEISLLVEQLKQPMVVKIMGLLQKADSTYLEVIEDDSPLQLVIDMLPELVESLYMMWVLSKGYRTDETMIPLLSRISWALCDKVERFLNVHKLFDDPTQIDDVRKRVKNLVYPIRTIDFSVFVFDNKENWDVIMGDFWKEEALSVLLKFLEFGMRESIRKQLSTKFDLRYRKNPPLLRNHPPTAGAIYWARALFNKMKELNDSVQKKEAFLQYKAFSKVIKDYEDNKYKDWVQEASEFTDVTWRDLTVHKLMQEYSLEFQPNFDKNIFLVIYEAELMEQLGNQPYRC
ncbi:putative ciliary dynein heavy chain, partial [Operophtera brumata]